MARFEPKDESELNPLLPKGVYDFEVIKAEDKQTKRTGADMIALTLRVWGPTGGTVLVNDWLVFMENCLYKVLHFCEATGKREQHDTGNLMAEDCMGATGQVKLDIQKSDEFGEQNTVKDYVMAKKESTPSGLTRKVDNSAPYPDPNLEPAAQQDDGIPF